MTARNAIPAALAALALGGCGGSGDRPTPRAPVVRPASAAGTFGQEGVTVNVRSWNCRGVYGPWRVRVEITGLVSGEGEETVVLRPGEATTFRDEFPVSIASVPTTAALDLRVRVDGDELDVEGEASAKALFVRVTTPIDERLAIRRGPIAECR